jgi:hypothetical protein
VAANGRSPSKAPVEHGSERNPPALPAGTKEDDMKKYLLATAAALTLGLSAPMVSADSGLSPVGESSYNVYGLGTTPSTDPNASASDRAANSSEVGSPGNIAEGYQGGFNDGAGSNNDASIDQSGGSKGAAFVEQIGNNQTATVTQSDSGGVDVARDNRAQVIQFGSGGAEAHVTQTHSAATEAGGTSDNRAEVNQSNANKSYAEVNQSGSANDAIVNQTKSNFASATVNQTETSGNSALIWQDNANGAMAEINQSGLGSNLADIFQTVDGAQARIDQTGMGNNAFVNQAGVAGGVNNVANVNQIGTGNSFTVQQ